MNIEDRTTIADYIRQHPALTYEAIAEKLSCSVTTINRIAKQAGIIRGGRPTSPETKAALAKLKAEAVNG